MGMDIDKLAWIHIENKRLLSTRSRGKDTYYIPGGKREPGESDEDALFREVKEELDVDLLRDSITFVGTFEAQAHGKDEGIVVRMTCYTADFIGELRASAEVEEALWLEYKDRDKSSPVDQIIFDWLKDRDLIE